MNIWNGKLMAAYKHVLNLYEINRDPRTIVRQLNGISTSHFQEIQHIMRISDNIFIKTTSTASEIIKFVITKPHVQCQFPNPEQEIFTIKFK